MQSCIREISVTRVRVCESDYRERMLRRNSDSGSSDFGSATRIVKRWNFLWNWLIMWILQTKHSFVSSLSRCSYGQYAWIFCWQINVGCYDYLCQSCHSLLITVLRMDRLTSLCKDMVAGLNTMRHTVVPVTVQNLWAPFFFSSFFF